MTEYEKTKRHLADMCRACAHRAFVRMCKEWSTNTLYLYCRPSRPNQGWGEIATGLNKIPPKGFRAWGDIPITCDLTEDQMTARIYSAARRMPILPH